MHGALGKASKLQPPSPQIKNPKGGRGRGGLDPLFTTDVQKTTRIFIILYSSGIFDTCRLKLHM